MKKFEDLGVTPALSNRTGTKLTKKQLEVASEGIWGEGGKVFKQRYEQQAGTVIYKDIVKNADGTTTVSVREGFTDLIHTKDGYGRYTIKGTTSTSRQWASLSSEFLEQGKSREAFKELARAHEELKKARDLSSLINPGKTPYSKFYDDFLAIKKSAKTPEAIEEACRKLLKNPAYKQSFKKALFSGSRQAQALEMFAKESNAMRKAIIRDMLEGSTHPAQKLWDDLVKGAKNVPFDKLFSAIFVAIDVAEMSSRAGKEDFDGAYRKALEAALSSFGALPALTAAVTNHIIDTAKEAGYSLTTSFQDCEDLLAGIISVKGWENAEGLGSNSETSIDELARDIVYEDDIKNIIATAIRNASQAGTDKKEVNEGKISALTKRCEGKIINAWRDTRMRKFENFITTLAAIDELQKSLGLIVEVSPAPATLLRRKDGGKSARVAVSARLTGPVDEIRNLLDQAYQQVKGLGGKQTRTLFDPYYSIKWGGIDIPEPEKNYRHGWPAELDSFTLTLHEPGEFAYTCTVALNLRVQNTIAEGGDHTTETFSFTQLIYNRLTKDSYASSDAKELLFRRTDFLKEQWEKFLAYGTVTTHHRGDPFATQAGLTKRNYILDVNGLIDVQDSDLDDSLMVRIDAPREILAGETAGLTTRIESAEQLDTSQLSYHWQGARGAGNGRALFAKKKPGDYPVQVNVTAADGTVYESAPVTIIVLNPDDAELSLHISGPTRVQAGESLQLRAHLVGQNPAGMAVVNQGGYFFRWSTGKTLLDEGPYIDVQTTEPGEYDIKAEMVADDDLGTRVLDATRHRLVVTDPEPEDERQDPDPAATPPRSGDNLSGWRRRERAGYASPTCTRYRRYNRQRICCQSQRGNLGRGRE